MTSDALMHSEQRRVRRPKDREGTIERLRDKDDGVFNDIRDVLTFAAALGFARGKRVPFDRTGEALRWETAINRYGTEALIGLIAVADPAQDKEVVEAGRFADRVLAFEEYANGGLLELEQLLASSRRPLQDEIVDLIQRELQPSKGDDALIDITEALS